MGMSEKHISQLINGQVHLTADVALRLEAVFGIPASFWNNLEAIYCEKLAKAKAENEMDADIPVSYTHLRAHETGRNLVCRLLLEKKKK